MKTKQEYLKILEIQNTNPAESEIKAQYRKLSKIYHTDNPKTGNKEKFISITEAKDALMAGKFASPFNTSSPKFSSEWSGPNLSDLESESFSQMLNDRLSEFLNIAGESFKKNSIKTEKAKTTKKPTTKKASAKSKSNKEDDYDFFVIKKLDNKTIVIFDLSELTKDKSIVINKRIFNFKV